MPIKLEIDMWDGCLYLQGFLKLNFGLGVVMKIVGGSCHGASLTDKHLDAVLQGVKSRGLTFTRAADNGDTNRE